MGNDARLTAGKVRGAGLRRAVHATEHQEACGRIRRSRTRHRGLCIPRHGRHDDETAASGTAGDARIVVPINDSTAGGTYFQPFVRAYAGTTPEDTPVYVYVPEGALDNKNPVGVHSLDPPFDPTPGDEFTPCADAQASDFASPRRRSTTSATSWPNQIVRGRRGRTTARWARPTRPTRPATRW